MHQRRATVARLFLDFAQDAYLHDSRIRTYMSKAHTHHVATEVTRLSHDRHGRATVGRGRRHLLITGGTPSPRRPVDP